MLMAVRLVVAMPVLALSILGVLGCNGADRTAVREASSSPGSSVVSVSVRPGAVEGPTDPHDLDLAALVPAAGRLDHVWYVPRGTSNPQVVVGWHHQLGRRIPGYDSRRYVLTVWSPVRIRLGTARWKPTTVVPVSPFSFDGRSIRLADVTDDGHDDLLTTIVCSGCNHGTAVVSVFATVGAKVRRIYGRGAFDWGKGAQHASLSGRVIGETWWGARGGLLWFDEPRGGISVCCPAYRLQTFIHWTGRGWRTVMRRRVSPNTDRLIRQPFP